jgi:ribonuclease P protein component
MISRNNRFKHRLAVQAAYRGAKTARAPMLSLKYSIKTNQPWRAAIVVSKKVSKSAVKRNRIRRRIYEWLRINQNLIPDGSQLIVSVFDPRIGTITAEELSNSLESLIKQVK